MTNLQGIPGFKIRGGYIAGKEYVRSGSNNNLDYPELLYCMKTKS